MIRFPKRFSDTGWVATVGGDAFKSMGSALFAFTFAPPREWACPSTPFYRIRVGVRSTILERRIHATPSGRCGKGRWARIDSAETPGSSRAWTRLGRLWAWRILEACDAKPGKWDWLTDRQKDFNRCRTRATANRSEPTMLESPGRGGLCKGLPGTEDTFGFCPASGKRVATHDARKVKAIQRRERCREASARVTASRRAALRRLGR